MMPITTKREITDRSEFLGLLDRALHHGNAPLALAITDLDGFGEINDTYGHGVGDDLLVEWERLLEANLPSNAQVIRLGGDEYVVVLPGLSAESALVVLNEIRS